MSSEPPQTSGANEAWHEPGSGSLPDHSQLVAHHTITRYGWSIISANELGRLITQHLVDSSHDRPLKVIAHSCAAEVLYEACRNDADPQRIEQGYTDLFRYLERIAVRRWPTHSPDIVQRALELTHAQIDRCRAPNSFLAFARYKLLQAAKEEIGPRAPPASLDDVAATVEPAAPSDVAAEVIGKAEYEELVLAIQRLPDHRQCAAVLGKYFLRQSDQAIAARLEITPQHLAVLRGRALKRLRADPRLRRLFLHDNVE